MEKYMFCTNSNFAYICKLWVEKKEEKVPLSAEGTRFKKPAGKLLWRINGAEFEEEEPYDLCKPFIHKLGSGVAFVVVSDEEEKYARGETSLLRACPITESTAARNEPGAESYRFRPPVLRLDSPWPWPWPWPWEDDEEEGGGYMLAVCQMLLAAVFLFLVQVSSNPRDAPSIHFTCIVRLIHPPLPNLHTSRIYPTCIIYIFSIYHLHLFFILPVKLSYFIFY